MYEPIKNQENAQRNRKHILPLLSGITIVMFPVAALAYVGPGAGITLLGSLFGLIVAIAFVVVGILLWPIRFLWKKIKQKRAAENNNNHPDQQPPTSEAN